MLLTLKTTPDLNFIRHFSPYYGNENYQFDRPSGISFAMVGNCVQMRVTDRHNNKQRTQVFTVDDMNIVYDRTIGDGGNGQRQIRLPTSVAVDLPKPFIVLVNRHNGIVKKVYFMQQKQFEVKIFNSTLQRVLQYIQ